MRIGVLNLPGLLEPRGPVQGPNPGSIPDDMLQIVLLERGL